MPTTDRQLRGTEPPASRTDIEQVLGPLDEETIERILAWGPTVDQLHMAKERLGHAPIDPSRTGSSRERVVECVRSAVAQGED